MLAPRFCDGALSRFNPGARVYYTHIHIYVSKMLLKLKSICVYLTYLQNILCTRLLCALPGIRIMVHTYMDVRLCGCIASAFLKKLFRFVFNRFGSRD